VCLPLVRSGVSHGHDDADVARVYLWLDLRGILAVDIEADAVLGPKRAEESPTRTAFGGSIPRSSRRTSAPHKGEAGWR